MYTPILDRLIEIMKKVAEDRLMFDMANIYLSPSSAQTSYKNLKDHSIHSCGTACCIIGYAVFDKEIQNMDLFDPRQEHCASDAANSVWAALEEELGSRPIADSIAGGEPFSRLQDAIAMCEDMDWSVDWLQYYPHITPKNGINTDSPQDAVDYMVELKRRLDVHYADNQH